MSSIQEDDFFVFSEHEVSEDEFTEEEDELYTEEPLAVCDSLDVTLAKGVKLFVDRELFELSEEDLHISENVVDVLDEFIDTLKGTNVDEEGQSPSRATSTTTPTPIASTAAAPGTSNSPAPGAATATTNANPATQNNTQEAPQTVGSAFILLCSLLFAQMRGLGVVFNQVLRSQWFAWLIFALLVEFTQKSLGLEPNWLSTCMWTATVLSATTSLLRKYQIFNAYEYMTQNLLPTVYSPSKLAQNHLLVRAAAQVTLNGKEPNYNAIMSVLIARPPLYQQATICIVSVFPWVLRDWKHRVELKRVLVLSQLKMKVQVEKTALQRNTAEEYTGKEKDCVNALVEVLSR